MPAIKAFIQLRWKTLMPFVALVATSLVDVLTEVDAPAGWKALALTALSSVLVYLKRNTPAVAVATPDPDVRPDLDRGYSTLVVILIVLGIILVAVLIIQNVDVNVEDSLGFVGALR